MIQADEISRERNAESNRYWNGNSWQSNRILPSRQNALLDTNGNPLIGTSDNYNGLGQGQAMYSTYLKAYIYCDRYV